jgi:glutamyl-tRNA(Gln) amidotransferase subunit D
MAELDFNPGDEVKLRLATREVDGRVLESSESGVILLKLKSGYNIGIPKENILGGKVVRKFREDVEKFILPTGGAKKKIGLVVTGGTIASKLDPKTGGVKHIVSIEEFGKFYPELFDIVSVKEVEMPFMLASESMGPREWKKIAASVEKMLDDKEIEGVIVTHGTDFLGYTGAVLSFMLRELGKPVVLTYAQRSIDRASSDANLNLKCAAHMAISNCAEVMIVGHASVNDDYCLAMGGTKTRKMHSSRRDAFKVINDIPIAKVFSDGKVEYLREYRARSKEKLIFDDKYEEKVALVKFYPGQDPGVLDYYAMKYKGIVLEVSGLGHLPVSESEHSWIPLLKKHIRNGLVVCAAPQTLYGRLNPRVYSNGRELLDAGVIFLEDMLPETALVKLGYVLGHHGWKLKVREKMLENMSGELNEKLIFDNFN